MINAVTSKIQEPEKINIEVINRLRKFRRDKELSQEKLAAMSGFHRNYIGMLERKENSPSLITLSKIAVALGVKLEKLFKGL